MRWLVLLLLTACASPDPIIKWKVAECVPVEVIVGVPDNMTRVVTAVIPEGRTNADLAQLAKNRKEALEQCNAQLIAIDGL